MARRLLHKGLIFNNVNCHEEMNIVVVNVRDVLGTIQIFIRFYIFRF